MTGLVLLALVLALPTLDNGFSLDDYNWLERAEFRDSSLSFILEPEPGQIFSPVGRGFFLLLYGMAGMNPLPYRLAVLALHLLNIVLLYRVVERVFARPVAALGSAFLFAVATSYDETLFWLAALFHPLNASLCLAALLGFLVYLEAGTRAHLLGSLLAYGAALLTKAPAFPFLLVLGAAAALLGNRPRSPWRALAPFAALWLAAAALDLVLVVQHSYLLERGYYRLGPHLATNLGSYLGWIAFPWEAAAERLGASGPYRLVRTGLEVLLPIAAIVTFFRAGRRVRFFLLFGLAMLLPFLPFVFAPASRYTYLAALALAPVAVAGLLTVGGWLRSKRTRTAVGALLVCALTLLSLADTMVRDNRYEYRERLMVTWVEDVRGLLPELPKPPTVRIVDLPLLGVDHGIHLEAALRLAYSEPSLRLETVPLSGREGAGPVLIHEDGRIRRSR